MQKGLDAVLSNLEFFLKRLRGLPNCCSLDLPGDGFCLSTGSDSASENWVFFREAIRDEGVVRIAVNFFETCGRPFIWPLLGDGGEILARFGIREAGHLLAMSRNGSEPEKEENIPITFAPVRDDAEAERWAEAVWRGFGAESGAPKNLAALVREMKTDKALQLVTARIEDRDAGTFLLASDPSRAGIYYFAVLPEFRRHGVATAMMAEILRLARNGDKPLIVLQATPAGVPFYRTVGFEPLANIPLFSFSNDVF